jgi:opacity protein-like surface antigen
MRRIVAAACLVLLVASAAALPAQAASTSVTGTNSYKKLVVNNGDKTLKFKLHAPGGKCDIKYLSVKFRDRDGTKYTMDGGCYTGATWAASLVRGSKLIDCSRFTLKFNDTKSVWTGAIPRTCLKRLAGTIKVTESYVDDYSPTPGEVPATKYVRQG